MPPLIKQMIEERARTNKMLEEITSKIQRLEKEMAEDYEPEQEYEIMNREVPLSALDSRVLDFVQSRGGMVCADDLVSFMGYKGRNAACTRLNRLYRQGVLDRYQLGHKVFYKFDAGKGRPYPQTLLQPRPFILIHCIRRPQNTEHDGKPSSCKSYWGGILGKVRRLSAIQG